MCDNPPWKHEHPLAHVSEADRDACAQGLATQLASTYIVLDGGGR